MLVALKPIYDAVGIDRINVSTYQAVSGAGKRAIEELATQTARLLNGQPIECDIFPKQIAFNTLPHIGDFSENGYTLEEMKMVWETHKIFEDESIQVNPTCVRVPVFHGHSEAVHIETSASLSAADARSLLENAPGVVVVDDTSDGSYPTPVSNSAGEDPVYVGRIRQDLSSERGLNLWIVSDNLRKGAALNSIQIAEVLIKQL
jgi:aspartate-semialdehyde dehydrogenase